MDQASSLNLGRDDKLQAHSLSRASGDSETFSLRDEDPLSEPSEGLLQHSKPTRHSHTIALLKTSAVNLVWILTWYMFATFLSVYNKWIFSIDHYNFQYPLFVTSIHMIVQFAFAGISITLVPQLRPTKRPTAREYLYKVFPCALATSLDIGLSNLSLKTITLTFYTMCKSSTLAFVLLFAFLFRLERPSFKLVGIICIIIVGVVLMVSDEAEFEFFGFVAVMSAAAFGGLRWALTEVLLRKESLGLTNPIASIFFLAPAQAVILIVLAAIVEGYPTIFGSEFFASFPTGMHTMFIVLAGGVLAFCMIMAEFFLIKRTSVVTLSVCGIFKEVATIFVSTIIFGDKLTVINTVGLCITLFGIGLYNWLKMRAAALKARKQVKDQELAAAQDTDFALDNVQRGGPQHMYSMVAESTPILLADGGMTEYRDSEDDDDDDYRHQREGDKRQRSSEQYELN